MPGWVIPMENKAEFLEAISLGMDIESASYLVGLSPSNVFRLLEKGKKEQERLSSGRAVKPKPSEAGALALWQEVASARSQGIRAHLANIKNAAAEDWKASKFILEHISPGAYSSQGNVREIEAVPLGEIEGY